ncbi:glycosyltransferase 87 family protein, partial [Halobacterium bonnevillei]
RPWRAAGVAFGSVALVKLFPALVGAWLLRQRAWLAIAAATATGVLGLASGSLVFGPETTAAYLTDTLAHEASVGSFTGGPDPTAPFVTVRRQLTAVFPGLPADWLLPASAFVLAPVFVGVNRVVDTLRSRLVALRARCSPHSRCSRWSRSTSCSRSSPSSHCCTSSTRDASGGCSSPVPSSWPSRSPGRAC